MNSSETKNISKDQIMCATGETPDGLFLINSGKIMVFVVSGTKVTPLAILTEGEYFGEMSFFDHAPRSANVVALEDTLLTKLTIDEKSNKLPQWLHHIAKSMVKELRESSDIIRQKGIRKQNVETIKPLSIEEQRHYYGLLQDYLAKNI